jgi:hypothetical protein
LGGPSILSDGRTDRHTFGCSRAVRHGTHDDSAPRSGAEDELSSRLFHKSNSGYGLTDAGEELLAGAEAIESAYIFAKAAVSSEGQPITGTVRLNDPMGLGTSFWRHACGHSPTAIPSSKWRS